MSIPNTACATRILTTIRTGTDVMKLVSTNPSRNFEPIGSVEISSAKKVQDKVRAARSAARHWDEIGLDRRIGYVRALANVFKKRRKPLSVLLSREMGMPISQAETDIDDGVAFLTWYCDHAHEALDPEVTYETKREVHTIVHEPRGVVAVIVPWNFPCTNFVWQCGQNLLVGNTIVFKSSEETPLFGKEIEKAFVAAKFPKGVFSEVYGDGKVGAQLAHADVDMLCFTGSTRTGRLLYAIGAEKMIPVHLELGGSSPGIVFKDTDVDAALDSIYGSRFSCSGQMCIALKRLIVHESRMEEVVAKLIAKLKKKKIGDALARATDIGPVVAERQVKLLEAQVADAKRKGAKILTGGKRPGDLRGAYYEPTVLTRVKKNMRVWQEEVFGPVLPVVPFTTEEEAVALANDTMYGLGAYIYTKDKKLFERVASRIQSGMVGQGNTNFIRPCNPFGGYKRSGLGREHGIYGFYDVSQIKMITKNR
jgi:succinate-semialdehyde dehydrogenase/glutarate-semialdehyde dehydrogenase